MLKKIFILFYLFISFQTNAQWAITPFGSPKYLIDPNMTLATYSNRYIWAGINGVKLSSDSGKTFNNIDSVESINAIINDSIVFGMKYVSSFDNYVIHKSIDYGKNWGIQYFLQGNDTGLLRSNIYMFNTFNEKYGFIIGDTLKGCHEIWRTQDGGNNWIKIPCSNIKIYFKASIDSRYCNIGSTTYFVSPQTYKTLLVGRNYGQTWDSISLNSTDIDVITGISFSDSLNGLLSYKSKSTKDTLNFLLKTIDGGYSWQNISERGLSIISYAKATKKNLGFYIAQYSPSAKNILERGAKVSFDYGYSWKRLDSLMHIKFIFKDAENGISAIYKDTITQLAFFKGFPSGFASSNDLVKPLKTEVKIYPNPAKEILNIESSQDRKYECINISGQIILSGIAKANQTNTLPISGLASGLYFLKFTSDNSTEIKKIIIE